MSVFLISSSTTSQHNTMLSSASRTSRSLSHVASTSSQYALRSHSRSLHLRLRRSSLSQASKVSVASCVSHPPPLHRRAFSHAAVAVQAGGTPSLSSSSHLTASSTAPSPKPSSSTSTSSQNTASPSSASRPSNGNSLNTSAALVQNLTRSMEKPTGDQVMLKRDDYVLQDIEHVARMPRTQFPISKFFEFGMHPTAEALRVNAQFLWRELPIRLAKRVIELRSLPYGLSRMPSIEHVCQIYIESFLRIRHCSKPLTDDQEEEFTDMIEAIAEQHVNVVPKMAQGMIELKNELSGSKNDFSLDDCPYLAEFLNRFYAARIAIRVLIGQHVAMHQTSQDPKTTYVGLINSKCYVRDVLEDAISDASRVCQDALADYPEVNIIDESSVCVPHVPSHMHYIFFELLKNAMRAVVETHGGADTFEFPPINVVISDGARDITIRISDQGGGIKRSLTSKIFSYTYTTASIGRTQNTSGLVGAPLAGFGYGLPIARLYARYFGGDVEVHSMDGYGTDAYVFLHKLGPGEEGRYDNHEQFSDNVVSY